MKWFYRKKDSDSIYFLNTDLKSSIENIYLQYSIQRDIFYYFYQSNN